MDSEFHNPYDVYQRLVPSETTPGQFDLITYQHVPDEFYEQNRLMREASKTIPIGEMHMFVRPPPLTWHLLCQKHPEFAQAQSAPDVDRKMANEIMDALRAMGEERCIVTVHRF
ncbi:hypothetical protein LNAOJCKE_0420 [Methylorubrum aminovorans]|uniref:Uncharacterized protein n=1 Tax=Methylorubrum aminovorans TaxID=269069 RepID=A0ABQ4U7K3_9HYPH|nr:hypothetical protein [Methylorubrum aminovorans]GJE63226.1 hypothetical protein LNAOJCKE_0420 [Methylorubrum aminovorans]GMA79269.1 hypothetical protein GCM10025880_56860 [Methylorubrum aminovorans]